MLPDLPTNIILEPSWLENRAETVVAMLESLVALATIMANDLDRFQATAELPPQTVPDEDLKALLASLPGRSALLVA